MELVQGLNGTLYAVVQGSGGTSLADIQKAIEDYFDEHSIIAPTINVVEISDGYKIIVSDADGRKEYDLKIGNADEIYSAIQEVEGKIPSKLSELTSDPTHRTISDSDRTKWDGKVSSSDFLTVFQIEGENGVLSDKIVQVLKVGGYSFEAPGVAWVQAIENALNRDKASNASKSYVDGKISNLIGSAPETLDTLQELADALGQDKNFSTTMLNRLNNKVDKVFGKGLSTNDLTNSLLNKINDSASQEWVTNQGYAKRTDLNDYTRTDEMPAVAQTGDYNDLSNTPDLSQYATKKELADKQVDVDGSLSISGMAADSKVVGDELKKKVDKVAGKGLSTNDYDANAKAKVDAIPSNPKYTDTVYDDTEILETYQSLVNSTNALLKVIAYTDDDVYNNEYKAWCEANGVAWTPNEGGGDTPTPTKTLTSISATYNGGSVDEGTSVNSLKTNLVVKAHYSDGSEEIVTGYTLSGSITVGNNEITVLYNGKTTTFTVVGNAIVVPPSSGGSNENAWTNGVMYEYEPVQNSYVETNGEIKAYNSLARTPYLYCKGASKLVFESDVVSATITQGNMTYNAFFDSNKQFVSSFSVKSLGESSNASFEITVPERAAYFIVSGKETAYGYASESSNGKYVSITPYGNNSDSDVPSGTDTQPVIEYVGKGINTENSIVDNPNLAVTKIYPTNGRVGLNVYLSNQNNVGSLNNLNKTGEINSNGTIIDYWSCNWNTLYTQASIGNTAGCTGVRITLMNNQEDQDRSYAYWKNTGEIIFAGKSTPYYGKTNISEVDS